jgi:glyoxylase-like metal-dependent hydrolase (beta-lactamase superfamily II)
MAQQIRINASAQIDELGEIAPAGLHNLLPDLAYQRLAIVNVIFIGEPGADWVLVDAGIPGMAGRITAAAEARYGKGSRPKAIVLTHGHSDHVGSLVTLAEQWDVPIYAHELEKAYLDGTASYPPPDPMVGGGVMSFLSVLFPRGPIDVSRWLRILPTNLTVPPLPAWRWEHVPGHTPGQIALWRESDRSLIAADAFITTAQESAYSVALQIAELHGPPMYYTQDWVASRQSVQRLAGLEPETAITGHGPALHGAQLRAALHQLANEFDRVAVPSRGKYLQHPAHVEDGTAYRSGSR